MGNKFLSLLAHTLIGVGFSFIHFFHVSSIFENERNFSHLSSIEREITFKGEESFYYLFYKKIIETDFDTGFEQLLNDNRTEYPKVINSVKKFHIYPEVVVGFLYKQFIKVSSYLNLPTVICWTVDKDNTGIDSVLSCEGFGEPIYFYLSVLWSLSGITVFLLYFYGFFLCRNLLGGLAAVAYYFCVHDNATNVHKTPMMRENFAFPFILMQIFYVQLYIDRCNQHNANRNSNNSTSLSLHKRNYGMIMSLILLTTVANLSWSMSTYIFAMQTFAVFILFQCNNPNPSRSAVYHDYVSVGFIIDYTISQILANYLSYYLMYGNLNYVLSAHMSLSAGLLIYIIKVKVSRTSGEDDDEMMRYGTFRRILYHLLFFISISYFVEDMSERLITTTTILGNHSMSMSSTKPKIDEYATSNHYVEYLLIRMGLKLPNFTTLLYLYNPHNYLVNLETIKLYNFVFVFKNMSLFIIINLGKLLKKRRNQINEEKNEMIERAKNYVIEDFLENHHVTMQNLTDPNIEKQIKVCLKLLEKCDYDYELYKLEKQTSKVDKMNEKITFLNDIKKLKSQINEKEKCKRKENSNSNFSENNFSKTNFDGNSKKSKENFETSDRNNKTKKESEPSVKIDDQQSDYLIQPYYFYFIVHTILIGFLSLKYILTPFLCLLASTLPSKSWFAKNSGIYWFIYVFLISCTLNYPGIKNIQEQYTKSNTNLENPELEDVLKWIDQHTDINAVFGAPIDITPQILGITGRPIVNHPLIEFVDNADRTKNVYSVFSKKSSTEIYYQLVKLQIQYLVIPYDVCYLSSTSAIRLTDIWDFLEPENYNNLPFCVTLFQKTNPTFMKIYENYKYIVIKIFSQSVQLQLKNNQFFLEYTEYNEFKM